MTYNVFRETLNLAQSTTLCQFLFTLRIAAIQILADC